MRLKLPTGTITIGPGTVPTSPASVSQTKITEVIKASRRASKLKLFDFPEEEKYLIYDKPRNKEK